MNDPEPTIIHSPLSGKFTRESITVDVHIYRSEHETEWMLEIVDSEWNSTVWDDPFLTDQSAYDQFLSDVEREGLATIISGSQPPTIN